MGLFADRCQLRSQPRVICAEVPRDSSLRETQYDCKELASDRSFDRWLASLYRYLCCNADMTAHMLGPLTRC
jgi:hypothetical protein